MLDLGGLRVVLFNRLVCGPGGLRFALWLVFGLGLFPFRRLAALWLGLRFVFGFVLLFVLLFVPGLGRGCGLLLRQRLAGLAVPAQPLLFAAALGTMLAGSLGWS